MDSYERLKKFGAGALIFLITVMMGIMFLPGSIQDFTGTFSSSAVGSYDGRPISQADYRLVYASCDEQVRRMGGDRFRNMQMANCTSRGMRELFVLADIGKQLGLTVSASQVQEKVLERARDTFIQQQLAARDSDDRLTLEDIYSRQLRYMPLDYRKRTMDAEMVVGVLRRRFPFPAAQAEADRRVSRTTLDIRFVRFSNAQLSRGIETRVRAEESEIRRLYDTEQSKLAADKRRPYEQERSNVERRVLAQKREAELKGLKDRLSKLGGQFNLEDVAALTGIRPSSVLNLPLDKLNEAKTENGSVNLSLPDLILKIAPGAGPVKVGPLIRDEFTYFIELQNVRTPPTATPSDEKAMQRELEGNGAELAAYLMREMIDQQAQRSEFKLKKDIFRQSEQ